MKAERHYPLSVPGTILLGFALFLTTNGAYNNDAYSLLAGIIGIVLIVALGAVCTLTALHLSASELTLGFEGVIYAKRPALLKASCKDWKPMFFCRLHLHMYGKIKVGHSSFVLYSEEFSSNRNGFIEAPLCLPLSGQMEVKVVFKVRDMFGISRAIIGFPVSRSLPIVPPIFIEAKKVNIDVSQGNEHKNRQFNADDERYYQREYANGDRLRDINWKSSSRLNQLITRISPETQDKTMILDVEYRPYHPYEHETLRTIALTQFLKSHLLSFLREAKEALPNLNFRIWISGECEILEESDEIDDFALRFAGVFPLKETRCTYGKGSWYIFSTSLDHELDASLAGREDAKVLVVSDSRKRTAADSEKNVRDHFEEDGIPYPVLGPFSPTVLPGLWLYRLPWTAVQKNRSVSTMQTIKIRII